MDPQPNDTKIEQLLAHEGWLRRFVVGLVGESRADDVLQDTWLAALRRSPVGLVAPRAWLRALARNLALRALRTDIRRRKREARTAGPDQVPPTDDMLERLDAHRQVAKAVAGLEEPYRTAVLLRYFEGLPPREIARRLGLSGSTVRTRIQRGLERVRGRLEGTDVRSLAVLILMPRAGELPGAFIGAGSSAAEVAAPTVPGILAMTLQSKITFAAAASILVALVGWTLIPSADLPAPAGPTQDAPLAAAQEEVDPPLEAVPPPSRSELVVRASEVRATPLRGRVLDPEGRPLPGAPVVFQPTATKGKSFDEFMARRAESDDGPPQLITSTDGQGRFAAAELPGSGFLTTSDEYVALWSFAPDKATQTDRDALIVAARRTTIRGTVVDQGGTRLTGVTVLAMVDGLTRFPESLDEADRLSLPRTTTNEQGQFVLDGLPSLSELELRFAKVGYAPHSERGADNGELYVELSPAQADRYVVHGTVIDPSGHLVAGANVHLGETDVVTGRYGEFEIGVRTIHEQTHLLVAKAGHQTIDHPEPVERLRAGERSLTGVVLQLGQEPQEIRGRVLDPRGKPLPGMTVALYSVEAVGFATSFEDLALGRQPTMEFGDVPQKVDARTDAQGSFTIGGLSARAYRLRVFDPKTLTSTTIEARASDTDLLVELDPENTRSITGIVRSRGGQPLADVQVKVALDTFRTTQLTMWAPGAIVHTDEAGRFALDRVPTGDVQLLVSGRGIIELERPLSDVIDGADLVIEPAIRCRFRVEALDIDADHVQLLDADDQQLSIRKTRGSIATSSVEWKLRSGRTEVLEVSDDAVTMVLLKDGVEVRRQPIVLSPDGVNRL